MVTLVDLQKNFRNFSLINKLTFCSIGWSDVARCSVLASSRCGVRSPVRIPSRSTSRNREIARGGEGGREGKRAKRRERDAG
jgi:hypothetical protein